MSAPAAVLASSLIGAITKSIKKTTKAKGAKKKKNKIKNPTQNMGGVMTHVSLPVNSGFVTRTSNRRKVHLVPFKSSNTFLRTDASNSLVFSSQPAGFFSHAIDISHVVAYTTAGGQNIFGVEIDYIRRIYAKWRLRNLRVSVVMSGGTTRDGLFAVGYDPDPFALAGSEIAGGYGTVAGMEENITGPMYNTNSKPISMSIVNLTRDWLFTKKSDGSASDQRFASAGSLYIAGFGLIANSTYGVMTLEGEMEFMDLVPPTGDPTGPAADGTNVLPAPVLIAHLVGDTPTATTASPFSPGVTVIPVDTNIGVSFNEVTLPVAGRYQLNGLWSSAVGATGAAALGLTSATILSSTFSPIAPYTWVVIAEATAPATTVAFTGPTGMTAGTVFLDVVPLP